jgi:hypothetical protein
LELIPLQAIPNQSLSILLGPNLFAISVLLGHSGGTLLTVSINDIPEPVISGLLSVATSEMMLPPRNLMWGSLRWALTDGDSYPDYTKFGKTHFLTWEAVS